MRWSLPETSPKGRLVYEHTCFAELALGLRCDVGHVQAPPCWQAVRNLATRCSILPRSTPATHRGPSPPCSGGSRSHRALFMELLCHHIRSLKSTQANSGITFSGDHPTAPWIVKHAPWLAKRYLAHDDGRRSMKGDGTDSVVVRKAASERRSPGISPESTRWPVGIVQDSAEMRIVRRRPKPARSEKSSIEGFRLTHGHRRRADAV